LFSLTKPSYKRGARIHDTKEHVMARYDVEEEIESGLKYTEEIGRTLRSLPVRDCCLWQAGVDEPISGLNLLSFRQRFGAISVPAEGIGGVETVPAFRRRGSISKLLTTAMKHIANRVPIVFLSDAIEELYEKFGAVSCLAEAYLAVPVRNVERMASSRARALPGRVRSFSPADLPAMVSLYNAAHAHRPWTHERHTGWNQLLVTQTWRPGSEVVVFERDAQLAGYAILREPQFGHGESGFAVDELTARDIEAAQALLVEVAPVAGTGDSANSRCVSRLTVRWVWQHNNSAAPIIKHSRQVGG
jgi:Acetyltransferase (GNAT) domain